MGCSFASNVLCRYLIDIERADFCGSEASQEVPQHVRGQVLGLSVQREPEGGAEMVSEILCIHSGGEGIGIFY